MKILAECPILDMVPANSDTEPQPAAGEKVDVGRLPRHKCRLALWKNQDPSDEPDALGHRSQIREHHEWVVERVALCIRTDQWRCSVSVHGPEHVLVGQ